MSSLTRLLPWRRSYATTGESPPEVERLEAHADHRSDPHLSVRVFCRQSVAEAIEPRVNAGGPPGFAGLQKEGGPEVVASRRGVARGGARPRLRAVFARVVAVIEPTARPILQTEHEARRQLVDGAQRGVVDELRLFGLEVVFLLDPQVG